MTTVTHLNIGATGASVTLDCGHVLLIDRMTSPPRPGAPYVCPDCLWDQFTAAELARMGFWRWLRQTGGRGRER
jgi:predicted RNA-binding Zn-ribbon protein involved in translation (DUF1610 family)